MYLEIFNRPPLLWEVEEWAKLALTLDVVPGPGGSHMTDFTRTMTLFRPLERLQTLFPGVWTQCTVSGLWPSSQIVQHRDAPIPGTRYHLPLQSNNDCWTFHQTDWQRLQVGAIYKMDPTKPHGSVNWGATIRLHLVVDVA